MKKFSKVSGVEVNEEPKVNNKKDQQIVALKSKIFKLIDDFLTIQSYGSAKRDLLNSSVKIVGKEMFADALLDFMADENLMNQIKALESLKQNNKDWETIDNKINQLETEKESNNLLIEKITEVKSVKNFINSYLENDNFSEIAEMYSERLVSKEKIQLKSIISEKLSEKELDNDKKSKLLLLSEILNKRSNEI